MIPLKDNIPSSRPPVVNLCIIGACVIVFLVQLSHPDPEDLVQTYGMIPARVTDPDAPFSKRELVRVRTLFGDRLVEREIAAPAPSFPPWLTLLTCIFLHGGWLHLLGNMWFLHVFGDNVEDRLGHVGYLFFYLASGVAASAVHLLSDPSSSVPTVGASGAIAGVMGSYLLLFPRARVFTLVPLFFFFQILVLPAFVFLGIWFVLQFLQPLALEATGTAGVAWWAHIGGFVVGVVLTLFLREAGALRERPKRAWTRHELQVNPRTPGRLFD